jgi:hypothetical protein
MWDWNHGVDDKNQIKFTAFRCRVPAVKQNVSSKWPLQVQVECILLCSLSARRASHLGLIWHLRPSAINMCMQTHTYTYIQIQADTYKQNIHACIYIRYGDRCVYTCLYRMYPVYILTIYDCIYSMHVFVCIGMYWGVYAFTFCPTWISRYPQEICVSICIYLGYIVCICIPVYAVIRMYHYIYVCIHSLLVCVCIVCIGMYLHVCIE